MNSDKTKFRALREMVGLSQQDVANALSVDVRTVKRWEQPDNEWPPRKFAVDFVTALYLRMCDGIDNTLEIIEQSPEGTIVNLSYWRSQKHWLEGNHEGIGDAEPWTWKYINATSRALAAALVAEGYQVEFVDGSTNPDSIFEME